MNSIEKLKQWKQSVLSSIQLDISLFKYEFKDNLKSFVGEILRIILTGLLTVPACLYLLLKWCLKVLLVFFGIYLFFWLYILFMKAGIYIFGVMATVWLFIAKK